MRRLFLMITVAGCVVAGFAAWRLHAAHARQVVIAGAVRPVFGDLQSAVTATGTLYPSHSVDIKFDGQEIVEKLSVKEGDHVAAGQVLAVMDTRVLDHSRLQNLQTAEKDAASLLQAEAAFHREEVLLKEGIVARADFDVTRASYESLMHQRLADQEAAKETSQQMERAVLRSPMNGTVVTVYVHAGEMLGSATAVAALGPNTSISKPTNVLMTVVEDGPLQVYAGVNAADLGSLAAGQDAEISIDAFQPKIFHGSVQRISLEPVVMNNVTTYQAIVTLKDGDPRFRIGLPADVMLLKTIVEKREIVPATSIFNLNGGPAICTLQSEMALVAGQAITQRPASINVAIVGRAEDAVAVDKLLPAHTWVLNDPAVCQQQIDSPIVLRPISFEPAPSFSNARLAKSKQSVAITNLPAAKPKSWLQNMLGL